MFCENCGKEIPDVASFCPNCGAVVLPAPDEEIQTDQPSPDAEKKHRRIWIPVVIVVAAVVVVLALLMGFGILGNFGKKSVELNDYVSVQFEGTDGYGEADITFDYSALGDDFDGDIKLSNEAGQEGYQLFSEVLKDLAVVSVTPDSGLSNGDEVTVSWSVDVDAMEPLIRGDLELVNDPFTIEVSDLKEIEAFDAFADVSVSFTGVSPDAQASLEVGESELGADAYSLDRTDHLAIGDTVTVSIDDAAAGALEEEKGICPAEMSRDYTVEGVASYVVSLDEIPDDGMAEMEDYAESVKTDKAEDWPESVHQLNSTDYVGSYLLTRNDDSGEGDANIIYLVYKLNVTKFGKDEDGKDANSTFDYYWYGSFTDLEILPDGSLYVDYDSFTEPGFDTTIDVVTYDYTETDEKKQEISTEYRGYEDLQSLYDDLVKPMLDAYTLDSSVSD